MVNVNDSQIRVLSQYIKALEDATVQLENMYVKRDLEGLERIKRYIREVQSRINGLIKLIR